MRATLPVVIFLLVLAIGIIVGVLFERLAGRSWLARQFSGSARGIITSALVGVAGAFVGYHIALLLVLRAGVLASVFAAAIGSAAVLFAWRMANWKYLRLADQAKRNNDDWLSSTKRRRQKRWRSPLMIQTAQLDRRPPMFAFGPQQTWASAPHMSSFMGKADMAVAVRNVR
jgi:uncharacterized membrane protein YeaQ/YmgE (transglycosylase-associated protein family)